MFKMKNKKAYLVATVLVLAGCDEIVTTQSAKNALDMCHYAALEVIDGSGAVEFPSSFHNPFRDPTVVRMRYRVLNSDASGTIRCYYNDDSDDRYFTRITLDDEDLPLEDLPTLTIKAKAALK